MQPDYIKIINIYNAIFDLEESSEDMRRAFDAIQRLLNGTACKHRIAYSYETIASAICKYYDAVADIHPKVQPACRFFAENGAVFTYIDQILAANEQQYQLEHERRQLVDEIASLYEQIITPTYVSSWAKKYIYYLMFCPGRSGYWKSYSQGELLYAIRVYEQYIKSFHPNNIYEAYDFFSYRGHFRKCITC